MLYAYNATDLLQGFYNSSQDLTCDHPGGVVNVMVPIIAGGKVFVGAEGELSVFSTGIFLSAPAIEPDGCIFDGSVIVTLSTLPGVSVYYIVETTTDFLDWVPRAPTIYSDYRLIRWGCLAHPFFSSTTNCKDASGKPFERAVTLSVPAVRPACARTMQYPMNALR